MNSGFISIPSKRTWEVDVSKPIRDFITEAYVDLKSSDYAYALAEFSKLRNNVVAKLAEKTESSVQVLCRYYDQLTAIDGKLPIAENQIRIGFKWQDAFTKKLRVMASSEYEKGSVLFSIAAMQTQIADTQSLLTDDGLKNAAKLFQQSSGIFSYLVSVIPTVLPALPVSDLHPDVLNALSSLTLAQAQECFVRKAVNDNMKPNIIAKLSSQCSFLYTDTLKLMQTNTVKQFWPKDWIQTVSSHQDFYAAVAQYKQSQVEMDAKNIGEYISRLRVARDYVGLIEKRGATSNAGPLFSEFQKTIETDLRKAEKDNGFIYHVKVPSASSLSVIDKAVVAKSTPISSPLSPGFTDLFQVVVPMVVRNAITSFETRKSELMFHEIGRLRDATRNLNTLLVTYNLPAAIEDLAGDRVPQSLLVKAAAVRQLGGIDYLSRVTSELPQLLQLNKGIVEQAERSLLEEESSDRSLRARYGVQWSLTPSEGLNSPMRQELAKYRTIITNALSADASVHQRFASQRNAIALLSQPDTDIERSLPSGNPVLALQGSPVVTSLRQQVDEAQSIKENRDKIENQLKDVKCDIASSFLTALMQDGSLNEASLCSEHLDRIYGALREQVAQSLKSQDIVVNQLQKSYSEFNQAKGQGQAGFVREKQLRELATAYDSFMDLKANIEEGILFYKDLTPLLTKFQTKVNDFCSARRLEKDELMKDLSGSAVPQSFQQQPQAMNVQTYYSSHSAGLGNSVNTIQVGQPFGYGSGNSGTFFVSAMPSSFNPYAPRHY